VILRGLLMAVVAAVALLVDTVVLANLTLAGVAPSLAVMTVVGFAHAEGPAVGVGYGFAVGLVTDLLGDGLLGSGALVLLLVGYLTGMARRVWTGGTLAGQIVAGAMGALLAAVGHGVLDLLFGVEGTLGGLVPQVLAAGLFGLLLAPLVLPALAWLLARLQPDQLVDRTWPSW